MPKIVELDELTINQIAAGEVIERPSSVVKELVENSIDANATRIEVEIKKGGIDYIKITDNGSGIEKEDMEVAFERHATSKIRSADDLPTVMTMGFRGEALASVASVARVEMTSKTEDAEGNKIVIEGGDVLSFESAPASKGTSIIVRNLFYNTPVRYKFLKKDYTEAGYVEEAMRRIALVNKDIAFKLINNGKVILQTPGDGDFKNVVYSMFGTEVASSIIEVSEETEGIRVSGVIGKPELSRSNRRQQMFFVNGRYIKDKTFYSAIERAYKGLITIGKFPFCILNIEMNPKALDVNVHPAKLEVRFENEQAIFKAIYNAVKTGLSKEELVEDVLSKDKKDYFRLNESFKKYSNGSDYNHDSISNSSSSSEFSRSETRFEDGEIVKENVLEDDIRRKTEEFKRKFESMNSGVDTDSDVDSEKIESIISKYKQKYGDPNSVLTDLDSENSSKKNASENMEDKEISGNVDSDSEELDDLGFKLDSDMVKEPIFSENASGLSNFEMESEIADSNDNDLDEDIEKDTENADNLDKTDETDKTDKTEDKTRKIYLDSDGAAVLGEDSDLEKSNSKVDLDIDYESEISNVKEDESRSNLDFDSMYEKAFGSEVLEKKLEKRELDKKLNASSELKPAKTNLFKGHKAYRIVGVLFKTYIILEMNGEMYMIDQHAANERVLFEKIRKNYYSKDKRDVQMLLLPDVITLSYREFELAKNNRDVFAKAGFEFEEFGLNTIKLVGVPAMVESLNTKELFLDILDEIDGAKNSGRKEIEYKFLATVACKAAVKAGMSLTDLEIESIISEMLEIDNPFTCPHGRPTTIKMSKYDIERKFSRT